MNLPYSELITLAPSWSKQDFANKAKQISQQLTQEQHTCVALWFNDASAFACTLLACLEAQVEVLLPPDFQENNQLWLKNNCSLLLSDQLQQANLPLASFSTYGQEQQVGKVQLRDFLDFENQTAIYIKTSGSSGNEPKLIKKTAQQMWREAQALAQTLPWQQKMQVLGSVSVQHLYGLTFRVFFPLYQDWLLGREQLVYSEYLIAASKEQLPSLWITSPTLLKNLLLPNPQLKETKVQGIISSGGKLPADTANNLRSYLDFPLCEIYGSSETGIIAWRLNYLAWQAFPQVEYGVNAQQALWVKSPWLSNLEQTMDEVKLTPQGFDLLGRLDRIVKINDKRVSLELMGEQLLQSPLVSDCYITQHPQYSRLVAIVVLSPLGQELLAQHKRVDLIKQLKNQLFLHQEKSVLPRYWRFCQQIPRNQQHKIDQQQIKAICLASH
ncbi:AMP-binding protein [Psittacicella gerlachiana]|uniref:AMP-dependent synthetase/ligase domain-containing protein n=1 Tax=Psittacicella gerlachiana TaxID=2028574 RepID=A0A3A1YGV3_9GAMM|nr:AMP-binding protein [Psittacicella gerlachiana]RIY36831.1 hypothetical protein CKF59_02130 [Psittacicella gerlachiana]